MGGQAVALALLLALGCNELTGVGDLKVGSQGCPAGETCDAGMMVSGRLMPEKLPAGAGGSGGGFRLDDAGVSTGGSDDCVAARDIPQVFAPTIRKPSPPCGGGLPIQTSGGSGGSGSGSHPDGAAGSLPGEPPVPGSSCVPGSTRACAGAALCAGSQSCLADGTGYASCECGPAPQARRGAVAAACTSDADCAAGLSCTTSGDIGGPFSSGAEPGGPQNGYCSRFCNTDADCQAFDPLAICLGPGAGQNHCLESCDLSSASFPGQCNARDDLSCIPLSSGDTLQVAYCAPACHDDAGCAPRVCNLGTGLCQDRPRTGKPLGGDCVSGDECADGICFALRGQPAVCTGLCTFGSVGGCGFAADAPERDAACADTVLGDGTGPGLCTELCDADSDCEQQQAGWVCTPWGLDLLEHVLDFNRIGFCALPSPGPPGDGASSGCNEDCLFSGDGECDDGEPGASTGFCLAGTDCTDCGAR
jgi:hypothetical protein